MVEQRCSVKSEREKALLPQNDKSYGLKCEVF